MKKLAFPAVIGGLIIIAIVIGIRVIFSSGGSKSISTAGDFKLHVLPSEYGMITEKVIPESESLTAAQQLVKLPGGSHPSLRWTTHIVGSCRVFEIDPVSKLPKAEIIVTDGVDFPSDVQFSISAEAGCRIDWSRQYPATSPTEVPTAEVIPTEGP